MSKVIGIVNLHDGPHLGKLTEKSPLAVIHFLGRYSFIDLTLSNMSNSGINKVHVLCESNSNPLRSHIGSGSIWVSNTKTGYLKIDLNEKALATPKFNTDIYNINVNLAPLEDMDCDYVLIAPPFFVNTMDYRELIEKHKSSKADITLAYTHVKNADNEFINCDTVTLNKKTGYVTKFGSNSGTAKEKDISLETFIFSKKAFIDLCTRTKQVSELYTLRKMVAYGVENKLWKVGSYQFKGVTVPMLSLKNYINYSFELLDASKREKLFRANWPIYTSTHNTPPALYKDDAEVSNSFIANGCIIKGKVTNSILSRDVIVEEGCEIKNSIIFSTCTIGKGVSLNYVLCGKNVSLKEVKKLSGDRNDVLYIKNGANV